MKKIAFYIDNTGRGGAQRVMCNLVDCFCSKGYEVLFINDFRLDGEKPQYNVNENAKRIFLQENMADGHCRVRKLRKLLKSERPEIIVSFMRRPNIRMLLAALGLRMKKYVSVRNDPKKEYGKSCAWKLIANLLFLTASGCVFQTEDAKRYFWEAIRRKSAVIYNPVDKRFFDIKREARPRDIVTFGRLEPQKNHELLLRAYAKLADKVPDDLYIYGEGRLREKLEALCRELNISDRVHLPGNISNVPDVLSCARLFVLSSDYEGMPNALMEAMAAGVPAIATDCPCGGPKELLGDVLPECLVPCGDVEALKEKTEKVLSDEKLRDEWSDAVKSASEAFEPSVVFEQWENYIVR